MTPSKIILKYNNFGKLAKAFPRAVGQIVRSTASDIRRRAIMKMSGIKSGRRYRRGKKIHIASAPGEAPAVDTAKLRGSLFVETVAETKAIVGVGAEYGAHLEFGTSKIAARPYMRPSAEEAYTRYVERLRRLEL